ncbi:hypothetical protein OIU79_018639 [Salix purpurea]|uniref:LysM domain-containing protein n=1 Tax=Salix purpurea TaxID=77065 RepID=A0A9Q1ALK7_SALPP|nr:hypothetical protein OIU79_018639 [Salix purpurea]
MQGHTSYDLTKAWSSRLGTRKLWRDMTSDDAIVRPAFMEQWKLKEIVGKPVSGSFWRENVIRRFAISHKIVRGDSGTSLAKKYSVQVMDVKRLNNIMSDHGIYSRESHKWDMLHAKGEVLVLYPEGKPDKS